MKPLAQDAHDEDEEQESINGDPGLYIEDEDDVAQHTASTALLLSPAESEGSDQGSYD